MKKSVAFFTVGFAFNRLVRMKFYEKIFPKDIKMYLITTNKYQGKEKDSYQEDYSLQRSEIIKINYDMQLPLTLRRICEERKIDRVFNLGFHTSGIILLMATLFKKRDYCLNILTDTFNQYKLVETWKEKIVELFTLPYLYLITFFARKVFFTDKIDAERAPVVFLSKRKKMVHLAAPVDTTLFVKKDKLSLKKELGLTKYKKVVIFVGRINYLKCSDILKKVIEKNPDILFILIGRLMDESIFERNPKNVIYFEKKSSKELVKYYNAADFGFCVNRGGGGIGLTSEETLACGTPIVVSKEFRLKESPAIYQVAVKFENVDNAIKKFFKLDKEEKDKLAKSARTYAVKNYSDEAWKENYILHYLH